MCNEVFWLSPFSPCRPYDIRLYIVRLAFLIFSATALSSVSDERQIPKCMVLSTFGICTPFKSHQVLDSLLSLSNLLRFSRITLLTGCRMYLSILLLSTPISRKDCKSLGVSANTAQSSAQAGATHITGPIAVAFLAIHRQSRRRSS